MPLNSVFLGGPLEVAKQHCHQVRSLYKRIAKLEADLNQANIERLKWKEWTEKAEAELASIRPQFEVEETVEFKMNNTGTWHKGSISSTRMHYVSSDSLGTCLIAEDKIRKPQPEMTPPSKEDLLALLESALESYKLTIGPESNLPPMAKEVIEGFFVGFQQAATEAIEAERIEKGKA